MLIWQDQQNVSTFLGTVPALLGADASGNVISIVLGTNLSFAGNVLNATGGGTPLTPGTGITFAGGTAVTSDLSTGVAGGQSAIGGTGAGETLTLSSTANVTKGKVVVGSSSIFMVDEANVTMTLGTSTLGSGATVQVEKSINGSNTFAFANPNAGANAYGSFLLANAHSLATQTYGMYLGGTGAAYGVPLTANAGILELNGGSGNMVYWLAQAVGDHVWNTGTTFPNPPERMRLTNAGVLSVPNLGAGGLVKATVTSGVLGIASAADVAAAITWPAATDVLVSSGTSTAPAGDSNFTYDTGAHTLTMLGSTPLSFGAGTQTITKPNGTLIFTTSGFGDFLFSPNATATMSLTSGGQVRVNALAAGGMVNAAAGTGQLAIATPGTDYQAPVVWPAASQVLVSAGVAVDPAGDSTFTFDRVAHVMAGGNAIGINGVSVPSNVSLCVGHTTSANRDRVQFLVGGGALGATGAGDNTFVDVVPANSSLTLGVGVAGGIYATQRIRSLTFSGGGLGCTVAQGASLYIDGAPSFVVAGGATWGIYVAAGGMHVGGALEATSTLSAPQLIVTGSAGNAISANGNSGPILGFFGASPLGQQTGGAASAGATYTATEQGMLNRAYSALRAYGLLT